VKIAVLLTLCLKTWCRLCLVIWGRIDRNCYLRVRVEIAEWRVCVCHFELGLSVACWKRRRDGDAGVGLYLICKTNTLLFGNRGVGSTPLLAIHVLILIEHAQLYFNLLASLIDSFALLFGTSSSCVLIHLRTPLSQTRVAFHFPARHRLSLSASFHESNPSIRSGHLHSISWFPSQFFPCYI
jgi:hypothetical protein